MEYIAKISDKTFETTHLDVGIDIFEIDLIVLVYLMTLSSN